jgi:hypothetical protein
VITHGQISIRPKLPEQPAAKPADSNAAEKKKP